MTRRQLGLTLVIAGAVLAISAPLAAALLNQRWLMVLVLVGLACVPAGILVLLGPRYVIPPNEDPRVAPSEPMRDE
jgi:hypothetical protein